MTGNFAFFYEIFGGMARGSWSSSSGSFFSRILLWWMKLEALESPFCWLTHPCMHGVAMKPPEFGCLCQHLDVLSVSQRWRSCGSFQLSEGCCFHGTCHHSHGLVLDSGVLFSSCFGGCRCCCNSISQDWSDSSNIEFLEYFLVCAQLCSRKLLHQCQP